MPITIGTATAGDGQVTGRPAWKALEEHHRNIKAVNWIAAFCLLVVAFSGTAAWSVIDRKRKSHATLHQCFRAFQRLAGGSTLLTYGMAKTFPCRCRREPDAAARTVSNLSPMATP